MKRVFVAAILFLLVAVPCLVAQVITIDGDKDAFYNALTGPDDGWVHIPAAMHNDNGTPDNNKDLSADLWVAWDTTYFYVYEEVKDNVVHLNNPTSWQNDVLEVYIDPDPAQAKTSGQLGFNITALDSGDVADPANWPGVINLKGYNLDLASTPADYARKTTADGYVLECRVKWDSLKIGTWGPVVPAVGNIFGMSVMNHDNDVATREASIGWGAILKDAVWNDPQLHGTVEFLADNKLKLTAQNSIVPTNVNANAGLYVPGADLFDITIDAEKDPFYFSLDGPADGFLQMRAFCGNDNGFADNDADNSAKVWTAWDTTNFYIYAEVTDNIVSASNSATYQNDVMELKIDPQATDSVANSIISFDMTALDTNAVLGSVAGIVTPANSARKLTANGYALEVAIPWASMVSGAEVVDPAVGNVFGMGINFHDNDQPDVAGAGRESSLQWAAVMLDAVWNTPKYAGTVEFLADHKLALIPSNNMTGVTNPLPYDGSMPTTIVVDGKKDPFYFSLTGPADGYLQFHAFHGNDNGFADNDKDASAKVWTAWDTTNFYIYADVTDNIVSASNSATYQNDVMELKIDPQATDSVANSIISFDMTALDTNAVLGSVAGIVTPANSARKLTANGYALEVAIPWASMVSGAEVVDPAVGNVFGMGINFHDNDQPDVAGAGRESSLQWAAVMLDAVWNTPKYAGTVEFLADGKLALTAKNNMTGVTNPLPYDGSVPTKIVVDAKKDPFYFMLTGPADGYLQFRYYNYNDNGEPSSDKDQSAKLWTAWDRTNFYAYAEVTDDIVSAANANTYQNDVIEFKIDPEPTDSTTNSVISFDMTALDTNAVLGNTSGTVSPANSARRLMTGGYALEVAIPWKEMVSGDEKVTAKAGNVFGMGINIHDNDTPDDATAIRQSSLQWAAVLMDAAWNTPKYLATVEFLADSKLALIPSNNMTGVTNIYPYDGRDYTKRPGDAVDESPAVAPREFALHQNYPNPFNPTTKITFSIPQASKVHLTVYDVLGREVMTLVDEHREAGSYEVFFDGKNLSSGIYFYRLKAGDKVKIHKMTLLK